VCDAKPQNIEFAAISCSTSNLRLSHVIRRSITAQYLIALQGSIEMLRVSLLSRASRHLSFSRGLAQPSEVALLSQTFANLELSSSSVNDGVFDGSWRAPSTVLNTQVNPTTGGVLGLVSMGTSDDYEAVIAAMDAAKEKVRLVTQHPCPEELCSVVARFAAP
jgi:hypothetical protein